MIHRKESCLEGHMRNQNLLISLVHVFSVEVEVKRERIKLDWREEIMSVYRSMTSMEARSARILVSEHRSMWWDVQEKMQVC